MSLVAEHAHVGKEFELHDRNSGIRAKFIEYGATLTHLFLPDRTRSLGDVVLGCPTLEAYTKPHPFFNCLVGRYANRIKNAQFALNGTTYSLEANFGQHHIHGGRRGFANRLWSAEEQTNGIKFSLFSPDGDQGYPGNLSLEARYSLSGSCLRLEITATTDRPTPISLTTHTYFNLSGLQGSSIRDHELQINSDQFTEAEPDLSQAGVIADVSDSPFDFRQPKLLGGESALDSSHPQVKLAGGLDHNFVISGSGFREAAILSEPSSGRLMRVRTNQPCMQVYTANTLDAVGKNGVHYEQHQGICFETQAYPDSLNHSAFPDSILNPGEVFKFVTEYEFSTFS